MILSTDYISSVCEIKTMENNLIATGILRDITSEYIEIASKVGTMPHSGYRTPVKVSVFNTRLGFRVLTGEIYTSGVDFIRVMNVISLIDYERRNFFRIDTNIRTRIFAAGDNEEEKEIPVRIDNVSLCGVGLITEEKLQTQISYSLRMRLTHKVCSMKLRVIREEEFAGEGFHYGCQITEIKPVDEDTLCAFIFERQREQIGRQRQTLL